MSDLIDELTGVIPDEAQPIAQQAAAPAGIDMMSVLIMVLVMTITFLVLFLIYTFVRNKYIFKYPVVFYERNGPHKTIKLGKGGYIKKKGIRRFKVKHGWWYRRILPTNPDTSLMETDGILHLEKYDPDTLIQKRVTHLTKPTRMLELKVVQDFNNYKKDDVFLQWEHIAEPIITSGVVSVIRQTDGVQYNLDDTYFEPVSQMIKENTIQEIQNIEKLGQGGAMKALLIGGGLTLLLILLIAGYLIWKG